MDNQDFTTFNYNNVEDEEQNITPSVIEIVNNEDNVANKEPLLIDKVIENQVDYVTSLIPKNQKIINNDNNNANDKNWEKQASTWARYTGDVLPKILQEELTRVLNSEDYTSTDEVTNHLTNFLKENIKNRNDLTKDQTDEIIDTSKKWLQDYKDFTQDENNESSNTDITKEFEEVTNFMKSNSTKEFEEFKQDLINNKELGKKSTVQYTKNFINWMKPVIEAGGYIRHRVNIEQAYCSLYEEKEAMAIKINELTNELNQEKEKTTNIVNSSKKIQPKHLIEAEEDEDDKRYAFKF